MPQPQNLMKAELWKLDNLDSRQEVGSAIPVQFNPETLKVSYSNQSSGGDQRGGSAIQYVGQGTTKLSFELWFDVTAPQPDQNSENDVRKLTKKVVDLIQPQESGMRDKFIPPAVRFLWGTFLFEGIIDSINESLEFFSEDGKPLRASLQISLTQQKIQFLFGNQQSPGLGSQTTAGSRSLEQARSGDTVQSVAARSGQQNNWQSIANANDIDNPRQIPLGAAIDTRMGA